MPEDYMKIVNNADEEKLDKQFGRVCNIVNTCRIKMVAVENFMIVAAKFAKYPDEDFKALLVKAADSVIDADKLEKTAVKQMKECE